MKTTLLHILILTWSLIFLTGCKIDGEEEITIHEDGSGDIRLHFTLPYKAFSKNDASEMVILLQEVTARHNGLSLIENHTSPYGKYCQQLNFHIGFDSAFDLERIILSEIAYFESHSDLAQADGGTLEMMSSLLGCIDAGIGADGINYSRELDLSPLFKGKISNGAVLGDAEFRYILNTPIAADSHNGSAQESSPRRLMWSIPLKTYFNQPFTVQAHYAGGAFRAFWTIITIIGVTLGITIYYRFKRRQKLKGKGSLPRPS